MTDPRRAVGLHVYALPLRTRFRGIEVREGVLVPGDAGWGEFSPFREYDDAEATAWWRAAVEAADDGWPPPVRHRVPVNATVPAVAADAVAGVLDRFPGCLTAKVKVAEPGQSQRDDEARLEAVRSLLGEVGRIRVDANGAWDVDRAARLLPAYDRAAGGLEYAEQPCATVEELAALRRKVHIPIAADQAIRYGWPGSRRPMSPSSRCSRSAGCGPACGSPRPSACPSWCRAHWRRRWASRRAWLWRQPCRNCPTRVGSPRRACLPATS
jgi:L-alanine-DL-glutamate epimerase-like enolase superfamily enzyme